MSVRATPTQLDGDDLERLATAENFPVASRLLPKRQRADLLAVYGFARLVDDIGDESAGDRLAELDWAESELDRAFAGHATHPVFVRLQPTITRCKLTREPFAGLIEANRQDQVVAWYASWDDLVRYCALSATPVGLIVLQVFGLATPERVGWSDEVCTALQVVEHLQDVGEDALRGRVYLPPELLAAHGCPEADLVAASTSPALRAAVADAHRRARTLLLNGGPPLVASLRGRPRWAVAGFCAGGHAALDAVERAHFDVLGHATKAGKARMLSRWASLLARSYLPKPRKPQTPPLPASKEPSP